MASNNLLERILNSVFYNSSINQAKKLTKNSEGLLEILKQALNKIKHLGSAKVIQQIGGKVNIFAQLIKYYAKGEYREIEFKNLIIIIASLIYFISPVDFVPDFLPIIGFADDIALLTFVYNSVSQELEKFETWYINKNLN